jgi:broad specificity phosphatase PhoE
LLLVRHAPTAATRASTFPLDEPLDERGAAAAALLGAALPPRCAALTSPALRCRQTAEAAGLRDPRVEPALAECDLGTWGGRTLADVHEAEGLGWIGDPESCAHGGESLVAFAARVSRWLDGQARLEGRAVAVTHAGVVKAAVVHALRAPLAAFWQVDVAPLGITELHAHDGRWTITCVNCLAHAPRAARSTPHEGSPAAEAASP